jgi:hypothetical protein
MNSVFNNNETIISPTPSRPSSRASSFIEDVKHFLAPLSRKSSRNSLYQEYNQQEQVVKKKTSHQSLFDAINICKPKQNSTPSYERRIIHQESNNNWAIEDEEVMGIHHSNGYHQQDDQLALPQHIPIRRKQIKQIESRQDRIDIYSK